MERQSASTVLPTRPLQPRRADWPILTALIMLSLIPLLGGIVRLRGLTGGATVTPDNARFVSAPLPVILHILAASLFCLLGAFQFAPGFRRRRPAWHRLAGRWLIVAGLLTALSGVWMTVFYAIPQPLQGSLLYIVRLLVGAGMVLSLTLAWTTVRRKQIGAHRAWMMRAYALGQGAGTQALIFVPYTLALGKPDQLTRDLLMSAAWVINLAVVELLLRRWTAAWSPA